jgi:hypothetical protein
VTASYGGFVVVCGNASSNRKVAVFGTATGRPFQTSKEADKAVERYEERNPGRWAIAMFIEAEEMEGGGDAASS